MMTGFERYTKKAQRAIFLEELEQVVPLISPGTTGGVGTHTSATTSSKLLPDDSRI
jgi:hypothetical protein